MIVEPIYSDIERALVAWDRQPFSTEPLARLRSLRAQLAERWRSTPATELAEQWSLIGTAQELLLDSNLSYEALTADEQVKVTEIEQGLAAAGDRNALPLLFALMLYRRAETWVESFQTLNLPDWAIAPFLRYCLAFPCFFRNVGEVDRYADFMIRLVDELHTQIMQHPQSPQWQNAALAFSNNVNLVPLYFCDRNVCSTFAQRSQIIEFSLGLANHRLEFEFKPRPADRQKIRLGILKTNYLSHPETFTTFPVFEWLDRDRFDITLYVINLGDDLLDQYQQRKPGDRIVQLTGSLSEQVQQIRADDLDLILLGTIVTNSLHRVLSIGAHRLARVQIHSVSSPVTSGMSHVDYYLSGTLTESPDAAAQYTEQLMLVRGPAHCFDYSLENAMPRLQISRSDLGISPETVVFVSGANLYKTIPELRETWATLLQQVPNSMLLLCPFGASWRRNYPKVQFWHRLRETLSDRGVDPNRAIVFDALPSRADVQEVLKLSDIYLDSFPFTGANSIVDAIEVGLPVVARESHWFRSRQGAAILRDVGLDRWIATSEADYLNMAVQLAANTQLRNSIREQLATALQKPPLCLNSFAYAQQVGDLFERSLDRWVKNLPAVPLTYS